MARIISTEKSNIYGFQSGKSKVLSQGQVLVVCCTMELYSHADTIFFGYNCIVMHYTVKYCDIATYTYAYNTIKAVPIIQADTA